MPPGSLAAHAVGTQIIRWPVTTTIWPPTSKLNDSTGNDPLLII